MCVCVYVYVCGWVCVCVCVYVCELVCALTHPVLASMCLCGDAKKTQSCLSRQHENIVKDMPMLKTKQIFLQGNTSCQEDSCNVRECTEQTNICAMHQN